MSKRSNTARCFVGALFMLTAFAAAQAESPSPQNSIEIYPPHSVPVDMTMMEQALHRRAVEVAIWAQPLLNYKAM